VYSYNQCNSGEQNDTAGVTYILWSKGGNGLVQAFICLGIKGMVTVGHLLQ
jgi:hypothetical protein